jgi:hypothetical protein
MKRSTLEKIDRSMFRSLAPEEQARGIGGAVSVGHTWVVTHVNGTTDLAQDGRIFDS